MKNTKETKKYQKPAIVKRTTMNFPQEILAAKAKVVVCKQCSSCHSCR